MSLSGEPFWEAFKLHNQPSVAKLAGYRDLGSSQLGQELMP